MEISLLNLLRNINNGVNVIKLNSIDIQIENHELQERVNKGDINKHGKI